MRKPTSASQATVTPRRMSWRPTCGGSSTTRRSRRGASGAWSGSTAGAGGIGPWLLAGTVLLLITTLA